MLVLDDKPQLILMDAMNIIHRSFFGYPKLTAADKTPTGALYGFVRTLKEFREAYPKAHIIVCSDVSRVTFRTELYPDYKQQRDETPLELKTQISMMEQYVALCGIKFIKMANYEADDLIGTLAVYGKNHGYKVYIASGDKDLMQLVEEDISQVYIGNNGYETMTPTEVIEKFGGLQPKEIIQYKALCGDPADNYKGVAGVGDKGAIKLLNKYHTLDNLYAHIDELKGKQKENLINDKDMAYLCEKLATIKTDIDLDFNTLLDTTNSYNFCNQDAYDYLTRFQIRIYTKADVANNEQYNPTKVDAYVAKIQGTTLPKMSTSTVQKVKTNYNYAIDATNDVGIISCISCDEKSSQRIIIDEPKMETGSDTLMGATKLENDAKPVATTKKVSKPKSKKEVKKPAYAQYTLNNLTQTELPCEICKTPEDEYVFRSLKYTGDISREALGIILYALTKCPDLKTEYDQLINLGKSLFDIEASK